MNTIFSYVAIPASIFDRAFQFYSVITGGRIVKNELAPFPMAYFVDKENSNIGHLFQLPNFKSSSDGVIVYMEFADDLNETLSKIKNAGGSVVMPKTLIAPGKGFWALFLDTEGNKLALHSNQ
jgi:predicted enzyme related to lactoylglutathione lyase